MKRLLSILVAIMTAITFLACSRKPSNWDIYEDGKQIDAFSKINDEANQMSYNASLILYENGVFEAIFTEQPYNTAFRLTQRVVVKRSANGSTLEKTKEVWTTDDGTRCCIPKPTDNHKDLAAKFAPTFDQLPASFHPYVKVMRP